jgi:hypothetical protein
MMGADWATLRARVAAPRSAATSVKVFGASGHRFVLHSALTGEELADLKKSAGARLPEDYRAFLLEIAGSPNIQGAGLAASAKTRYGSRTTCQGMESRVPHTVHAAVRIMGAVVQHVRREVRVEPCHPLAALLPVPASE